MINYPTWKFRGSPTPSDTIWICDGCGTAIWHWHTPINIPVCYCRNSKKKNPVRFRRGTEKEQDEAKKHLKRIY